MNLVVGALILAGVPLACIASGAWLRLRLGLASPAQRLAVSLLAGLCALLLALSATSLVLPLSGWALALVFVPLLLSLARPAVLGAVWQDARAVLGNRRGQLVALAAAGFVVALLWPLLTRPGVVFYDGTANHDAFFWIVGADHLRDHTCLTAPGDAAPLATRVARYISGLRPEWGRMGAEGYLATVAGLTNRAPLTVYLWSSAALYSAWLAAVFLIAGRFVLRAWSWPAVLALGALQPLFAFYHHNANLPNLLGMLCGATLVLATDCGLRTAAEKKSERLAWGLLAALALHGVLVTYPEIAAFILLPCALLLLRAWHESRDARRALGFGCAVLVGGLALNPLTTWRAVHGLQVAAVSAQANALRPDFLAKVAPLEAIPALVTLSTKTGGELGAIGGAAVTFGLLAALVFVFRGARDRIGLAFVFAGGAALLAYTFASGFHYGWQKTAQFSGVFLAAALPVGAMALWHHESRPRFLYRALAVGGAAFFLFALVVTQLDLLKWSGRKALTAADLELGRAATKLPAGKPVGVASDTFTYPFFSGMWAAYLIRDRPLAYSAKDPQPGGYLTDWIDRSQNPRSGDAVLVSRAWADATMPTAPRVAQSENFVLLTTAALSDSR